MNDSEFEQVASFATAAEAEQVCSMLKEQGLLAFVDGAHANTALSYVGSALGGVRVFVMAGDVERADELLDALDADSNDDSLPWFCGKCQEEVDGTFQICWSCGKNREDVQGPFPVATGEPATRESIAEQQDPDTTASPVTPDDNSSNPYASPRTLADAGDPDEQQETAIHPEVEGMLQRAWRASVIGLVVCPLILHAYSMYLLIRAALITQHFSSAGRKRYYGALAINVVVGCLWTAFLNAIF